MAFDVQSTHRPFKVAISIPANTDNDGKGTKLSDLIGPIGRGKIGIRISANQPAVTTDRAAFLTASPRQGAAIAATDFTTHGEYHEAGEEWQEPSDTADELYVRSADGNAVPALAIVY